jgi:AcrR family transcriptional regulator
MSTIDASKPRTVGRPKRADALRNYEAILAAARDAFAAHGESTTLEEIARRANVGIGTLYRHFPTRRALVEALYVEEVEEVCRYAGELAEADPWDGLSRWFGSLIPYIATKQVLANELLQDTETAPAVFLGCRSQLVEAGEPLLERAQAAGVVRSDVDITQLIKLVAGIAKTGVEPAQIEHLLTIALDGLRYRPQA